MKLKLYFAKPTGLFEGGIAIVAAHSEEEALWLLRIDDLCSRFTGFDLKEVEGYFLEGKDVKPYIIETALDVY